MTNIDKEYILKEIEKLTKELQKPIKRPADIPIRNHLKAWLDYYKKKLDS